MSTKEPLSDQDAVFIATLRAEGVSDKSIAGHVFGVTTDLLLSKMDDWIRSKKKKGRKASGQEGVRWDAKTGKWQARILMTGEIIYLGSFDCLSKAVEARIEAEKDMEKNL